MTPLPFSSRAVLWDVDGTLVDTAELHYQAWQALAQELQAAHRVTSR